MEGAYAQTRSCSFPTAFNTKNIGLPVESYRDEYGQQIITKDGITSNCEQLRNEQYYQDPLATAA